jgi:hypothetical protein
MEYQTPADIIARDQARLRAAMWWMLPAFALGLVGFGLGFLGQALGSRALGIIAFGVGAVGVGLGFVAVARTSWASLTSQLRKG